MQLFLVKKTPVWASLKMVVLEKQRVYIILMKTNDWCPCLALFGYVLLLI